MIAAPELWQDEREEKKKAQALRLGGPGWISASVSTGPVAMTWSLKLQPSFEKPRPYISRGIVPVTGPHHMCLRHFSATITEYHTLLIDENFTSRV